MYDAYLSQDTLHHIMLNATACIINASFCVQMSCRSKAKRKTARKCHSNGKRRNTGKGGVAARPHVMESRKPLRLFTLDLQPDEIAGSHARLINDILAMLEEDVRDEMRKLRKKDKKPETVHGKPYTPKDGAFLVELVHPGKRTVTLLFGKNSLYLNGLHVSGHAISSLLYCGQIFLRERLMSLFIDCSQNSPAITLRISYRK